MCRKQEVWAPLTLWLGVDVVVFDGAGQTQQLDQPAVVLLHGVDVATGQDLRTSRQHFAKHVLDVIRDTHSLQADCIVTAYCILGQRRYKKYCTACGM